jgi:hypothetical protein
MTDAELAIVVKLKDLFSAQLNQIVTNTGASAKKMESSWQRLSGGITAAKAALAGWLGGQAAQFIKWTAETAAKADLANVAFGSMAKRINLDVTVALDKMREASKGTVADLDLMATANKAIMLGAVQSGDELEKLTYYGTRLGNAMGLTASQGIEYFTTGLARQSSAILDNVGIIVDMEAEYKKLGKTAADLTEDERRSIFSDAVWRKAEEGSRALGTQVAKTAEAVQQFGAMWDNVKVKLAETLVTPFTKSPSGKTWVEEGLEQIPAYNVWKKYQEYQEAKTRLQNASRRVRPWDESMSAFGPELPLDAQLELQGMIAAADENERVAYGMRMNAMISRSIEEAMAKAKDEVNTAWDAMSAGAAAYYKQVGSTLQLVGDAIYNAFQDIERNIGDVFFDAMMGKLKSFKDYLRAFVQDIARTISQAMSRQIVGQIANVAASALGSLSSTPGWQSYEKAPYPVHAYGGITAGPSFAGEAGPEAVVPLPGSRKIPVEFQGGGMGQNVTYNIYAVDAASFVGMLQRNKASVHQVMTQGLLEDMNLRAAVRAV